jgi:hypothetical protein
MAKVKINEHTSISTRGIKSIQPDEQGNTVIRYIRGKEVVILGSEATTQEIVFKVSNGRVGGRPRR